LFKSKQEAFEAILSEILTEKGLSLSDIVSLPGPERTKLFNEAESRRAKYAKEIFQYQNTTIIGSPEDITFDQFLKNKGIDASKVPIKELPELYKSNLPQWQKKHGWGLARRVQFVPSENYQELIEGKVQFPYKQLKRPPMVDIPSTIKEIPPPVVKELAKETVIENARFKVSTKVPEIADIFNRAAKRTVNTATTREGVKLAVGIGAVGAAALIGGSVLRSVGRSRITEQTVSEKKLNEAYGVEVPETAEEFFGGGNDTQKQLDLMSGSQSGSRKSPLASYGDARFNSGELIQISPKTAEVDMSKFTFEFLDADTVSLTPRKISPFDRREPISVRLTGIDAPEVAHASGELGMPQGKAAKAALERKLKDGSLRVVISTDPKDKTKGRYVGLAYNEFSSKPLNLQLAEEGLASTLIYKNVLTDEAAFKKAEREAVKKNQGIWSLEYYKRYREERSKHKGRLTFNVLSGESDYEIKQTYGRVKSSIFARDEHLQVEGLDHFNFAQHVRHVNTDFGSSWDIVRSIAKGMYKGVDADEAYQLLMKNQDFTSAIRKAIEGGGTKIGSGLTADVYSHTANFKHGIADLPEEFEFITKQYTPSRLVERGIKEATSQKIIESSISAETKALRELGGLNAPSLYGTDKNILVMEKFKGKTLEAVKETIPEGELFTKTPLSEREGSELYSFMRQAHKKGISHTDLHTENIMRVDTPEGSKIGVIDWGMANRLEGLSKPLWEQAGIEEASRTAGYEILKRDIPLKEFQERLDIGRVYAHTLEGIEAKTGENVIKRNGMSISLDTKEGDGLHKAFNQLQSILSSDDRKRYEISEDIARNLVKRTEEAAGYFENKPFVSSVEKSNKQLIPAKDDAYNIVEGLHPKADLDGVGTAVIRKNTDFGSGSRIAINMWKTIQKTRGTQIERVESFAKRIKVPLITNTKKLFNYMKEEYLPATNKSQELQESILFDYMRQVKKDSSPHSLVEPLEKAFAFVKPTFFKDDIFSGSHEVLEVLHARRINKFSGNKIANISTHVSKRVIEDEAFIAYMRGNKEFKKALLFREQELKRIAKETGVSSKEQLVQKVQELRRLASEQRRLRNDLSITTDDFIIKINDLSQQKVLLREEIKKQKYHNIVKEIYAKTPQEVEQQIKELNLTRELQNNTFSDRQLARMNRFRKSAIEAVGVGLKKFRFATKGHTQYGGNR
jgi:endonuclease YncB( thermonuclease family)/tRNA A-37 threonylcarbamoyl transferase component Bud32